MPPGCEVSMAAGDRERSGCHVLAGRPAVIEQHKQDRLSADINRRLSQSLRQVRLLVGNLTRPVGMTPRVRGLSPNVDPFPAQCRPIGRT